MKRPAYTCNGLADDMNRKANGSRKPVPGLALSCRQRQYFKKKEAARN
ncbi:hypothetical protein [Dysgonomonas termitidis]|uniref:Uncharacterized protein n=1 Tax=Dysgonomonas termitidis TaxID=1516126 RepID=A0ABV9KR83_9BACT